MSDTDPILAYSQHPHPEVDRDYLDELDAQIAVGRRRLYELVARRNVLARDLNADELAEQP